MILAYPLCVRIVVVICVFSRLVHCGPYLFDFFFAFVFHLFSRQLQEVLSNYHDQTLLKCFPILCRVTVALIEFLIRDENGEKSTILSSRQTSEVPFLLLLCKANKMPHKMVEDLLYLTSTLDHGHRGLCLFFTQFGDITLHQLD